MMQCHLLDKLIGRNATYLQPFIDGEKEQLCAKLQFFDIGGSPKELMAYMVKSELLVLTASMHLDPSMLFLVRELG